MKKRFPSFKKTDIDFVMRTFVYALLILAILHAFKPYFTESSAGEADASAQDQVRIEEVARQSKVISSQEVAEYLKASERPTMLVVYASWCGYCKKLMPSIYQLWKEGKINGEQMLVISVDLKYTELAKYLVGQGFDKMLGMPILLKKQQKGALAGALRPFGSSYDGGIPYIGFFSPGGKLRDEIMGYVTKKEVEASLVNLR